MQQPSTKVDHRAYDPRKYRSPKPYRDPDAKQSQADQQYAGSHQADPYQGNYGHLNHSCDQQPYARQLLSDISRSEREEALQYYNDYLNDAGVENEQEVLESMGTPEQLARTIKEGLGDNGGDGEFTETGYHNKSYEEAVKNEVVRKEEKKRLSGGMIILLILLCIMALPMLAAMLSNLIIPSVPSCAFHIICLQAFILLKSA